MGDRTRIALLVSGVLSVFIWSVIHPHDLFTWFLEVLPVILGGAALAATHRQFQFTFLVYLLMGVHAVILMVGGHYTYAEVPLFNWLRDAFELGRNHYDRVGHFAQGFIPAMIVREILLRQSPLKKGKWLFFLVVCVCLAISATYELFEWTVAEFSGTASDSFLGTQGDVWDTQKDMAFALVGSVISLVTLGKVHDRFLDQLARDRNRK